MFDKRAKNTSYSLNKIITLKMDGVQDHLKECQLKETFSVGFGALNEAAEGNFPAFISRLVSILCDDNNDKQIRTLAGKEIARQLGKNFGFAAEIQKERWQLVGVEEKGKIKKELLGMLQNYVYDDKEPVDFADSLQKAVAAVAGMDGGWFGNIVNILNSTTLTIQARETAFKALGNSLHTINAQKSFEDALNKAFVEVPAGTVENDYISLRLAALDCCYKIIKHAPTIDILHDFSTTICQAIIRNTIFISSVEEVCGSGAVLMLEILMKQIQTDDVGRVKEFWNGLLGQKLLYQLQFISSETMAMNTVQKTVQTIFETLSSLGN